MSSSRLVGPFTGTDTRAGGAAFIFPGMTGKLRFRVQVQPRASKNEIVGKHGDALKIRVTAPPVDSAANEALIALLAEKLGVARQNVRIVAGATSRAKLVEVAGVSQQQIEQLATGPRPR